VIYCVVPQELGEDTYLRLVEHYKDNPHVKVIFDRRKAERRKDRSAGEGRTVRDRRHKSPHAVDV